MGAKKKYEPKVYTEATSGMSGSSGTYYLGKGTVGSNYSWKTFVVGILILILLFFVFFVWPLLYFMGLD